MYIAKRNNDFVTFEDLEFGNVFMVNDEYYMVVNNPNDLNNAVNLDDGQLCHFDSMQAVHIVDYIFEVM